MHLGEIVTLLVHNMLMFMSVCSYIMFLVIDLISTNFSGVPLMECCHVDDTSAENMIVGVFPS